MRVRLVTSSIAAALLLGAGTSAADPDAGLSWSAPQICPAEEDVRELVRTWLGQPPGKLDLGTVRADARVHANADGFALELALKSAAGSDREQHQARRCETLAKIVALKIALAVDPLAAVDSVEPQPVDARARARPEAARGSAGTIRADGGVVLGLLPGASPAMRLVGSLRWSDFRLELGLGYWFPRSVTYDELPAVGARLQMAGATARACPTALFHGIEMLLCAGAEAGLVRAKGFGTTEARISDRAWVSLILGPAIAVPVFDDLYLWLEADAAFALVRPGFRVRNLPRLYKADSGAAEAWAGLELRFGGP
jgi:hypothetical protein